MGNRAMPRQAPQLSLNQKLRLNAQLATSIKVLRLDASGLTRYLEEQAAQNPCLVLSHPPPETLPWLPRWTTAFAAQAMSGANAPDIGALLQSPAPGLIDHVTRQITQTLHSAREREIARAMIDALEPSGWLGRPLAGICGEIGCSLQEAEPVLTKLQGMEPTGIFARSLSECLALQAAEADQLDPVMALMLDHLDLLAEGQFARLATLCKTDNAQISARLRIIRSFDPKPGARFGQIAAPVREPDLMVSRGRKGWGVALNRSALPDVSIGVAARGQTAALAEAREVMRAVANRNHTLLQIAQTILTRQEAVLAQGLEALQPMCLHDIAKPLDLHISTISRAIAGVSVDTPRGVIWLRALFTEAIGGKEGGGDASGALRARLLRLVRDENPSAPLSDLALAAALAASPPVARRTVAKYRALLNIPPAHRRKRAT
jgi:RNA polymerase sigma-54 factor